MPRGKPFAHHNAVESRGPERSRGTRARQEVSSPGPGRYSPSPYRGNSPSPGPGGPRGGRPFSHHSTPDYEDDYSSLQVRGGAVGRGRPFGHLHSGADEGYEQSVTPGLYGARGGQPFSHYREFDDEAELPPASHGRARGQPFSHYREFDDEAELPPASHGRARGQPFAYYHEGDEGEPHPGQQFAYYREEEDGEPPLAMQSRTRGQPFGYYDEDGEGELPPATQPRMRGQPHSYYQEEDEGEPPMATHSRTRGQPYGHHLEEAGGESLPSMQPRMRGTGRSQHTAHHQEDDGEGEPPPSAQSRMRGTGRGQHFAHHQEDDGEGEPPPSTQSRMRGTGRGQPFTHRQEDDGEDEPPPARMRGTARGQPFAHRQEDDGEGEPPPSTQARTRGGRGQPFARHEEDDGEGEPAPSAQARMRGTGRGQPFAQRQEEDGEGEQSPSAQARMRGTGRGQPFARHQEDDGEGEPAPSAQARMRGTGRGQPFAHHDGEGEPSSSTQSRLRGTARGGAQERPSSRSGLNGSVRKSMRGMQPFSHHTGGGGDADRGGTMNKTGGGSKGGGKSIVQAVQEGPDALKAALVKTNGGGLEETDGITASTPLMLALEHCAFQNVLTVLELLLDHGAIVNSTDVSGNTPLMYCLDREAKHGENKKELEECRLEWVKLLLDYGADPMMKNRENPPMTSLEKRGLMGGADSINKAMHEAMKLRKMVKELPRWQPGQPAPNIPRQVLQQLSNSDASKSKPMEVMEAYRQAVEVLQANPDGLHLDFNESDSDFVPASNHKQTEPLRKALECADSIVRKYGKLPQVLSTLVFEGLLPLQVDIYAQYKERYSSGESTKALARFVAGKNKRFKTGYDWAFRDFIEGPEADDLKAAVELAESFPKGDGAAKPKQIKESLEEVMYDAVRMQRRVVLLAASVAQRSKATHLVVHKSGGGREVPSSKRIFRSHEKVCLGTGPSALLDVARGGIKCPTMKSVCQALQGLLDEAKSGRVVLLRIKMRFHLPSDGGWRDALVNFLFADDESQHVCELQVMHDRMMTIRADMGAHKDYAQIRGAIEILEVHGLNWQDEAGPSTEEAEDPGEGMNGAFGRSKTSGSDYLKGGGTKDLEEISRLSAQVAELEKKLRERDRYIAELELQLQAAREGPEAAILTKFKRYDEDGDGFISRQELRAIMHSLDMSFSDDEISAVFDKVDKDGSGMIDYQEFVRWVCQVGSMDA